MKPNAQALAVAAFAISIALLVANQAWARLFRAVFPHISVEALANSASAAHTVSAAVAWAPLALATVASEPWVAIACSVEAVASVVAVVGAAFSVARVAAVAGLAFADPLQAVGAVHAFSVAVAVVLAYWDLAKFAFPHWISVHVCVANALAVGLVASSVLEAMVKLCAVSRSSLMFVFALARQAVPGWLALAPAVAHAFSVSTALWIAARCL